MDGTTLWQMTRTGVELRIATTIHRQVNSLFLYITMLVPALTLPGLRYKTERRQPCHGHGCSKHSASKRSTKGRRPS